MRKDISNVEYSKGRIWFSSKRAALQAERNVKSVVVYERDMKRNATKAKI